VQEKLGHIIVDSPILVEGEGVSESKVVVVDSDEKGDVKV